MNWWASSASFRAVSHKHSVPEAAATLSKEEEDGSAPELAAVRPYCHYYLIMRSG